jgi:hypothetical protein
LEIVPLACLLCWYTSPNLFGLFALDNILAQALCGEVQPDFLSETSISMPLAILMILVSSKGLRVKQGVYHQLLLSHLRKYVSSQSFSS